MPYVDLNQTVGAPVAPTKEDALAAQVELLQRQRDSLNAELTTERRNHEETVALLADVEKERDDLRAQLEAKQ